MDLLNFPSKQQYAMVSRIEIESEEGFFSVARRPHVAHVSEILSQLTIARFAQILCLLTRIAFILCVSFSRPELGMS